MMTIQESQSGIHAPKRRIVSSYSAFTEKPNRSMKKPTFIQLECGHIDIVGKSIANQGWTYCFDCYYNKPAPGTCVMCKD